MHLSASVRPAILAVALMMTSLGASPIPAQSSDQVLTARTFINVAKKVLPTVVSLDVRVRPSEKLLQEFEDNGGHGSAFGLWRRFQPEDFGSFGSGSGVIIEIREDWAYVLTNRHVLEKNERVEYTVTLDGSHQSEKHEVTAEDVEVVGWDELTDIAVLRFRMTEHLTVEPAVFGDSDSVEVGEWVLALGNPLDLNNSVSQGIISAKNRDISTNQIEQLLQTTAVINPGNSGGPLVNLDGKIVGINNAIATNTGQWSGVGFAIPSNTARRVASLIIRDGKIARGFLGITMTESGDGEGVSVVDVTPSTPAAAAGVLVGDVVLSVDGKTVSTSRELLAEIGNRFAGEEIRLAIRRRTRDDMNRLDVAVKLTERPAQDVLDDRRKLLQWLGGPEGEGAEDLMKLGFAAEPDTEGRSGGMRITRVEPGSPAARSGLRRDDLLMQLNGIDTTSPASLVEGLGNVQDGKAHVLLFRRDGSNQFVTLEQE